MQQNFAVLGWEQSLTWQAILTSLVLLLIFYYVIYNVLLHPLAGIPGPILGKYTDLWKFIHMYKADFSSSLSALHSQYGKLVRIAPNEVSVLDANEIHRIYGHGTAFTKSQTWYAAWSANTGQENHFSDRDPATHALRRRAVAHIYSVNSLLQLEPFVDTCTDTLIKQLAISADAGTTVDLAKWLHFYAFDVVGELALGRSFGLLETGGDATRVLNVLKDLLVFNSLAGQLTFWRPILYSKAFSGLKKWASGDASQIFREWVSKQVFHRLRAEGTEREREDMLGSFMKAKDSTTRENLDPGRIFNEVYTVLGAGSDTTAISLRAFMFYILQNPQSLERVVDEIDEAYGADRLSPRVTYAEASKLTYFQACLKESMRLQPAVGMHLPRAVPKGGCSISGKYFPGGSVVGISPKLIHRTEEAYGKTAHLWDPDRWLDDRAAKSNSCNLAFGSGSRVCIGVRLCYLWLSKPMLIRDPRQKNISLMEMSKLLPVLLRHFRFKIARPEQPWKQTEMWFEVQTDFIVYINSRF